MLITLIWYAGVILLYYRKELKAFIDRKPVKVPARDPLPHRWEGKVDELPPEPEDELMGRSKMPDGMSVIGIEEIQFANPETKTDHLGLVSDVIEEVKMIFKILVQEDGNKQDFLKMIAEIKNRYPKIGSNSSLPQINEYIISNASFHISPEELENLW